MASDLLGKGGVGFEWHVQAASGYAELGMFRESLAELDAIVPRMQNRPEVLHLRLHHLMRKKRWRDALRVSQMLCRVAPDCGTGFLHAGFCLHQLGKTAEAKVLLSTGPVALLKEPIYYYNMGCYDALLGNVHDVFHRAPSDQNNPAATNSRSGREMH